MDENSVVWIPQFKPCAKCNNGFIVQNGVGVKCDCRIEYNKELCLINLMLQSNVIQEFSSEFQYKFLKNYDLNLYRGPDKNDNKRKIEKFITNFTSKFNSVNLFFTGEPGTQKTTLSKYILCSFLKKGISGYYIIANDLFNLLTDSERNEESKEKLRDIMLKEILIIDEFDENKITLYSSDWKQKFILPFLKQRLETIRKTTIFISNKKPDQLGEKFEGAIQDLIQRETEDTVLKFDDKYSKYKEKINIKNIWDDD